MQQQLFKMGLTPSPKKHSLTPYRHKSYIRNYTTYYIPAEIVVLKDKMLLCCVEAIVVAKDTVDLNDCGKVYLYKVGATVDDAA